MKFPTQRENSLLRLALVMAGMCMMLGCAETQPRNKPSGTARLTIYNPSEKDRVKVRRGRRYVWHWVRWGRRTASGAKAQQGVTLAAPQRFPFGTRIRIPLLKPVLGQDTFVVQDRGGGVSRFGREWFDLFVDNQGTMKKLVAVLPDYCEYQVQ